MFAGRYRRQAAGMYQVRYEPLACRSGGMGRVYLCLDRETGRRVAVKVVNPDRRGDARLRRRFLEEAANWIFLVRHPNIVQAFRVDQWDDPPRPCLVLEYVGGDDPTVDASLAGRLRRGRPMPFGRTLRVALDVARGMRYASTRIPGLVHRDLKPGNVLIDADWRARVTDFGIARSFRGVDPARWARLAAGGAEAGEAPGTPRYRAPEQWNPINLLDERADIYSFGCILHEMLTARPAAPGTDNESLRRQHCTGVLDVAPEALPEAIRKLIRDCTALKRHHRPKDWHALERAVAEAIEAVTGRRAPGEDAPATETGESPFDRLEAARSYVAIGASHIDLGQFDLARLFLDRALTIAGDESCDELAMHASKMLGLATAHRGDPAAAIPLLDRCLALARARGDDATASEALSLQGTFQERLGLGDRAEEALRRAADLAEQCGDVRILGIALGNLANFRAERGQYLPAIELYERILGLYRDRADHVIEAQCLENLGAAQLAAGDSHGAVASLKQALELAGRLDDLAGTCHAAASLSRAYEALGRPRLAAEAFERHLDAVLQAGSIQEQLAARRKAASLRARLGHYRIAQGHLDHAQRLAGRIALQNADG